MGNNQEISKALAEIKAFFLKNWKVNLIGLAFCLFSFVDAIHTNNFSDFRNTVGFVLLAAFSSDSVTVQFIQKLFSRK